ncbi:unnamed protein product [Polarella glacialis]|uniref:EF-hand domain-containing protein n=1 Tax=Polarella glacialis TaxID=89957 RepID=A0A813M130_POLGL|nr:unnamed protein product [Polarella glacialis]
MDNIRESTACRGFQYERAITREEVVTGVAEAVQEGVYEAQVTGMRQYCLPSYEVEVSQVITEESVSRELAHVRTVNLRPDEVREWEAREVSHLSSRRGEEQRSREAPCGGRSDLFSMLDQNHDGVISREEFQMLGLEPSACGRSATTAASSHSLPTQMLYTQQMATQPLHQGHCQSVQWGSHGLPPASMGQEPAVAYGSATLPHPAAHTHFARMPGMQFR